LLKEKKKISYCASLFIDVTKGSLHYYDNKRTFSMTKNLVFHRKRKHIDIRYHFIRDLVQQQLISFKFCQFEDHPTNIFTKAPPKDKFENLRLLLGIKKLDINGGIEITDA
jgi:hypothetical protein